MISRIITRGRNSGLKSLSTGSLSLPSPLPFPSLSSLFFSPNREHVFHRLLLLLALSCIFHQMEESHYQKKASQWARPCFKYQVKSLTKAHENGSQFSIIAIKPAERTKSFLPWATTLLWLHKRYLQWIPGISDHRTGTSKTDLNKDWIGFNLQHKHDYCSCSHVYSIS